MTGEMWAGDVGQDLWDEVDRVVSAGNYGWPLLEGNMCFLPPSCDTAGVDLEPPVHVYPHPPGGNAAIIGGRVYNGSLLPGLTGKYIFGDWNGGKIWSLDYDGMTATVNLVVAGPPLLTAIGTDQFGELYGCYINGVVRKLVSTAVSAPHDAASASRLVGSHPNPFNPTTTVTYEVTTTARVRLTVHDARGARVRTLVDGIRGAGTHQQPWDGNTAAGVAASGVYFCRLQIDGETVGSIRLVLVK